MKPPTVFGYATTSRRSAWVMRAIDSLPAGRQTDEQPRIGSDTVISSIAGLGDLVIQLPLIAGLVNQARSRGADPLVALRPAHQSLGEACGWRVLAFENPLVDFFGHGLSLSVLRKSGDAILDLRRRKINQWIDLTGNAFNAVALRLGGVRRLYSAITRGGGSLVHGVIPHTPYENEYACRERLAAHFGCDLDRTIYQQLATAGDSGEIVLAITTYNRWKSWPLANFTKIVQTFPERRFALVGALKEIPPHEMPDWEILRKLPNVSNLLDSFSLLELARCIAHSSVFVGNDSGATHLANAYQKPGAVIFGPTISETWHGDSRLRLFHDQACPHFPCTAWKCEQPENWCMVATPAESVIAHLQTVLAQP